MPDLTEAVRSGDCESAYTALRDTLFDSIFSTDSGKDISALAKRWLEVCSELGCKQRGQLEQVRDKLARAIDASNSGRDVASLSIRLLEVMREIEALPDPGAGKNPAQAAREMIRNRGSSQR